MDGMATAFSGASTLPLSEVETSGGCLSFLSN